MEIFYVFLVAFVLLFGLWFIAVLHKPKYECKFESFSKFENACYSVWCLTKSDGTKISLKVIHDRNGYMYIDGVASIDGLNYIRSMCGAYDGIFVKETHEKFINDYLKQKEDKL